jgi:prepilin-type processing-associated H-X9-DG protein
LVELLVVISILGVLFALLMPAVQSVREASRRESCASNLKQLDLAVMQFEASMSHYPPGRIGCDDTLNIPSCPPGLPTEKKTAASGFVAILPYLEQQALYDRLAVGQGGLWNRNVDDLGWWYANPAKAEAVKQRVAVFNCPSDTSSAISDVYAPVYAATGSYCLVQGSKGPSAPRPEAKYDNDGLFLYVIPHKASDVVDGTAQTYVAGEVIMADMWESSNTWTYARLNADSLRTTEYPLNTTPGAGPTYERQNGAMGSQHPGGALFAYADGHVEMVHDGIDLAVYRAASTIAGED